MPNIDRIAQRGIDSDRSRLFRPEARRSASHRHLRKDKVIAETGYLTDHFGREAVRFTQQDAKRNWFV